MRPVTLGAKDSLIIRTLLRDPRSSVEGIANKISQPPSTVQKRLAAMLQYGYLERVIRVADWAAAGYPLRYRIQIKTNDRELNAGRGGPAGEKIRIDTRKELASYILRTLGKNPATIVVQDVTILLGTEFDLSVMIRANGQQAVIDFVTTLRSLGGVDSTIAHIEVWSSADGD